MFTNYQDKHVAKSLTKEVILARKRRNVITLSGQVVTFVVENFAMIMVSLVLNGHSDHHPETNAALISIFLALVIADGLACLQLLISSELRKHYLKFEV